MSTATVTTSTAASAMLAAPLAEEQPAYRYAGHGAFLPANSAAWREVERWNEYAARVTAQSAAARSAVQ